MTLNQRKALSQSDIQSGILIRSAIDVSDGCVHVRNSFVV